MVKGNSNSSVVFHLNGEKQTVNTGSNGVGVNTMLVDYIRDVANLKGTKVMCREGGCGACIVSVKVIDAATGSEVIKSVNSCLTPVLSCDGWDISTVERLGNKQEGYHKIQNRIVNFHGTQCGACTGGVVMNLYSLLEAEKDIGVEDVEKSLDGNICRCTGYRPILEAAKSLAKDAPKELQQKCADIEDCATCPMKKSNGACANHAKASSQIQLKFPSGEEWLTAKSLQEALTTATQCVKDGVGYRFVAGNTSTGIYKNEGPYKLFIDVNGIPELKKTDVGKDGITLGGGTSLTEAIELLNNAGKLAGLEYGKRMVTHLERVANVSVRNNGTLGGNLMIKHAHHDFPSDIFILLEAIGASLTIASSKSSKKIVSMTEFLEVDMTAMLIVSIHLPKREGYHFRSFKITRRYQNAHAYVNAALLLKVNKKAGFIVEGRPSICFGGISSTFVHATAVETALEGKSLTQPETFASAIAALESSVKPEVSQLEASPDYRIQLTKSLLYKTILEIIGEKAGEKLRSGGTDIPRNISSSKQSFDRDLSDTSLYKYVPKYEGAIQASGEAEYTADIPVHKNELFGAFVTSTVSSADISGVDVSEALKLPGVVRYVCAKDIPGENNTMKYNFFPLITIEPIFATDKVSYNGQSIGLILATTREVAFQAAKLVKVTYANIQKPVIEIEEAIEKAKAAGTFAKQTQGTYKTNPSPDIKVTNHLKGELRTGAQYHFYMETMSCVCHPREDGIDVYTCTQWIDHVQNTIVSALAIPANNINVQVRRLGGGFGGKVSRTTFIATACAVACWASRRPVRIVLDLETNMSMLGGRLPYSIPYEVGFDDKGQIGSLKMDLICDPGWSPNDATAIAAMMHLQNVYKAIGWEIGTHWATTNTSSNTACRAPGSVQSVAAIEWVMEHIANYLDKDPIAVREVNLLEKGDSLLFGAPIYERENLIPRMIKEMKDTANFEARKKAVEQFNQENRWKKRGLGVVPVRYAIEYFGLNLPTSVAIYHIDGTVAVSHGGIEMGQGLNTKVIQTVAQALQIPMSSIKIKPTNNFIGCNSPPSGGSQASEVVCYSALKACEEIRENLRPILEKMENPSWEKLVAEAHNAKVKLTSSYTPTAKDDVKGYDVWVVTLNEVEIDVLTGEYKVVRTDLYEDAGKSLSPGVDIGQIEGGFVFGQGYWTTEKIIHDENTGKLLTNGTWDYKPPESRDIPEDFRITMLSNSPNPHGILRSKATGEPSVDSAFGIVLAMRNAIASARADAGNTDWFEIVAPVTPEDITRLCLTKGSQLTL